MFEMIYYFRKIKLMQLIKFSIFFKEQKVKNTRNQFQQTNKVWRFIMFKLNKNQTKIG